MPAISIERYGSKEAISPSAVTLITAVARIRETTWYMMVYFVNDMVFRFRFD